MRRALVVTILSLIAAAPLAAQTPTGPTNPPTRPTTESALIGGGGPIELEGYFTHFWVDQGQVGGGRQGRGGGGLRIMFRPHRMTPGGSYEAGFVSRLSLGAFGSVTSRESDGTRILFAGGEADWELFSTLHLKRLSPFIGMGAGGWRLSTAATSDLPSASTTKFAFAPGVGVYAPLTPGFVLRGDLRLPIVFASATLTNFELSAGAALRF